jgi:xanthine dehydrogenase accessory factor
MKGILQQKNIYAQLLDLLLKNHPVSLATVTETHGSTPQKPGSSAIFGEDALITGTVGGGMVEFEVQKNAYNSLKTGRSAYHNFHLDDDVLKDDSVICGGGMSVLIDATPQKHQRVFESLLDAYQKRIPGVLVTCLHEVGDKPGIERYWIQDLADSEFNESLNPYIEDMLSHPIMGDYRNMIIEKKGTQVKHHYFLESIVPLPRLVIAGAGHVGKALCHLGKLLDFEVTIWDDRKEFANERNVQEADHFLWGDPVSSLGNFPVDRDTYIVIVTRGHKQDADVLKLFTGSDAGYIGMMGSSKKVAQIRQRFLDENWATEEEWSRVNTPIGIDINSKTVQEIALSISAELVKRRYEIRYGTR